MKKETIIAVEKEINELNVSEEIKEAVKQELQVGNDFVQIELTKLLKVHNTEKACLFKILGKKEQLFIWVPSVFVNSDNLSVPKDFEFKVFKQEKVNNLFEKMDYGKFVASKFGCWL